MAIKSATVRAATGVKPVGTNTATGARNTPAPTQDYSQRNNTLYARLNLNNQGARTTPKPTNTSDIRNILNDARKLSTQQQNQFRDNQIKDDLNTFNSARTAADFTNASAGRTADKNFAQNMEVYNRDQAQEQKVFERTNQPTFIDSAPKDLNGRYLGEVRNAEEGRQHEINMLGQQNAAAQGADARKYQFQTAESTQDRASAERLAKIQSEAQQNAALYSGISSLANRQYNWQYWGG